MRELEMYLITIGNYAYESYSKVIAFNKDENNIDGWIKYYSDHFLDEEWGEHIMEIVNLKSNIVVLSNNQFDSVWVNGKFSDLFAWEEKIAGYDSPAE